MKLGSHNKTFLLISVLLVIVTGIVYRQVTDCKFLAFDDPGFVTNNPHIKGLTGPNLRWAMTGVVNGNWQPVIWLSYMLDAQFHGLDAGAFHLTNLILHIANTLLLLLLLYRMTGSLWKSAFVTAVFALHPLHVESVAWVSERKDVLSTLFWLLTMLAYIRYAKKPRFRRYVWVLVAFALGLAAKPMLVTLPIILLLLDYWPLGRMQFNKNVKPDSKVNKQKQSIDKSPSVPLKLLVLEKLPLIVLALGASVVTVLTQRLCGTVQKIDTYPIGVRAANAAFSYVVYLRKMIWPSDLTTFYPHPGASLALWQVLGSAALVIALTWLIARSRRQPYAIVGWMWYLITLVPVIGLVQVGAQAMADRYTYIPMIGIAILIAWSVPDILLRNRESSIKHKRVSRGKAGMAPVAFIAIAAIAALAVCTYRQVGYWQDDFALFNQNTKIVGRNSLANEIIGNAYYKQGKLDIAEQHFREAISILPDYFDARQSLASMLIKQQRYEEAESFLNETLKYYPNNAQAHMQLGLAYLELAKLDSAQEHLCEAIRIRPRKAMAHEILGIVLVKKGKIDEAIEHLSKAVEISPDNAGFQEGLAYAKSLKLGKQ
ncbi:MAG: tetratricopeptide repeat protein [Armatimonadota bacterium]